MEKNVFPKRPNMEEELTTVTLASTNIALLDDGVTAPKHVGAV